MQKSGKKPYISIIVPVYNVEPYLERSLGSIARQTYRDFETILVDDGSTDASGAVCDRFAASHVGVTVIHKSNSGATSARKAGLKRASGEFVASVDPDDWIEEDYFEKMAGMLEASGADMAVGNHFRDIGSQSYLVRNRLPAGLYTREGILPQMIYTGEFFAFGLHPSLCTKLVRRSILEKIQPKVDEDIVVAEDAVMVYASILEAEKVLVTDICGYHYVQRQGSLTKSERADDVRRLGLVFETMEGVFREKGVWDMLRSQVIQWKKFLFLERQIQVFDRKAADGSILVPYGGIAKGSRIVIYGGSALGQTIDRYIRRGNLAETVLWIDKAYGNFRRQGLPVCPPEEIKNLHGEFDYVLLASVTESIVESMTEYLLGLQVPKQKIRWLTEAFVQGEDVF